MVPGHEGVEIAVRPTGGDALEGECQPSVWIDSVEFGCGQHGGYVGPTPSSAIGTREQSAFADDRVGSDGSLDNVGVDFDPAVCEEAFEGDSTRESIADRFGQSGISRQARQLTIEGCEDLAYDCARSFLSHPATMVGIVTADLLLDLPEWGHGFDDLCSKARALVDMEVEEFSPRVAPTSGQCDIAVDTVDLGEAIVGGIAVDLEDAVITGQMPCDAVTAPAVFEPVGNHGRIAPAEGGVVTRIGPEPSGLHFARFRRQGRQCRFVGEDPLVSSDIRN